MKGREPHGIVTSGNQYRATVASLREQLLAWRDPANGQPVVKAVYETNAIRQNAAVAPDLIVGYSPGHRASWQTGLGGTPAEEIVDNNDAWIGDHCINPADVPGVLFTSKKDSPLAADIHPSLADITAAVLHFYNAP